MTAPQVTTYLVEHSTQARSDPFMEQLIAAALDVRATQPDARRARRGPIEPLTAAELRVLRLLPTSTYFADSSLPPHLTQHREGPPPIDLPEARGNLAFPGHRAGS